MLFKIILQQFILNNLSDIMIKDSKKLKFQALKNVPQKNGMFLIVFGKVIMFILLKTWMKKSKSNSKLPGS